MVRTVPIVWVPRAVSPPTHRVLLSIRQRKRTLVQVVMLCPSTLQEATTIPQSRIPCSPLRWAVVLLTMYRADSMGVKWVTLCL